MGTSISWSRLYGGEMLGYTLSSHSYQCRPINVRDNRKSVVGPWFFNIVDPRKQGWDSSRIEVYSLAFLYMVTRYLKILNNVVIYTPLDAVKFNLNHKMVALNFK
jgi:hypothetical protein